MSIEIRLTKELGDFEPKLIGPFTGRQCLCLLIGFPFCYFTYRLTAPYFPVDVAGFLCFIPGGLAAYFGWAKPYGMKPEKFLRSIWINILMAPTNRRYKTQNAHEKMIHVLESAQEQSNNAKASGSQKKKENREKFYKRTKNTAPEYYL